MMQRSVLLLVALVFWLTPNIGAARKPLFRVLAFYSTDVERDHVDFARQALTFFEDKAKHDHFTFEATTQWDDLNPERLKGVQVVLWLNDSAHTRQQQSALEQYMQQALTARAG